jgi:hypothetical protein
MSRSKARTTRRSGKARQAEVRRRAKATRRAKRVAARRYRTERSRRRWHWDVNGLLILVGAVFLLSLGFWMARDTYLLQQRGEVVEATVLDVSSGRNARLDVRYTTKAGRTLEDSTSNFVDDTVGGTVEVVYDPEEPTRMQAADWGFDYVPPGLLGVAGVTAVAAAGNQLYRRAGAWRDHRATSPANCNERALGNDSSVRRASAGPEPAGGSVRSSWRSVVPLVVGAIALGSGVPAQGVTEALPSVPLEVKVVGTLAGVELTWTTPAEADNVTGYVIHRSVGGVETTYPWTWGSARAGELAWTQSERPAGATYSVSAASDEGEGPASTPVAAAPTTEAIGLTHTVPVEGGNYRTYAGQVAVQGGTQVIPLAADGPTHVVGDGIATSPDGREIVFAKGQQSLWRVRTDVPGATPVQLVSDSTGIYRMAWSPDGTQIVYERLQPDSSSCLDMVAATGGTPVRIGCHLLMPTWLPDNQTIIAKDQFQGLLQRIQARANGAVLSSIAGTQQATYPTVSPDGRWLGFVSGGNAPAVIPLGGGTPKLGEAGEQSLASIAWSPDGTKLLINRYVAHGGNVLKVLPVDGTGQPGAAVNVFRRPWDERLGTAVWQGPRVVIKPTAAVNGPNVSIPFDTTGMATPLTVTCQLDGGPATACSSPYTKTGVAGGSHVLQVKAVEPSGRATVAVRSFTVDAAAPAVRFTSAAFALTKAASVNLAYAATDSSGVGSYDVRYRTATYLANFGGYITAASATKATSLTLNVAAGNEYCVSVRARDVFGTVSAWSAERCFSRPMDDRSLTASAGWSRGSNGVYFLGTVTSGGTNGASLTRTVQAKRLYLIATRCRTCGSLQVYYGGRSVGSITLYNETTEYQAVIGLPTPATFLSGTLQLTIRDPGTTHQIDGLAVRRT